MREKEVATFVPYGNCGNNLFSFKVVPILVGGVNGFAIFREPHYDLAVSLLCMQLRLGPFELM